MKSVARGGRASPAFYKEEVERARQASLDYRPETLASRYVEYFRELVD